MQLSVTGSARDLSKERQTIASTLAGRSWFQATGADLQHELLTLPEDKAGMNDWTGLLQDLAERPESIGGVTQRRLLAFMRGNFGAIIQFEVANEAGTVYTYEYFSWRYGPMSGAKGIVFVRAGDAVTHFIVLKADKFAPAKRIWDSIGGFADLGAEGVVKLLDRIKLEIQQELGASDLAIGEVIDLGRIMTDPGMTNNNPAVFAAIIDARDARKVRRRPVNGDEFELTAGALVLPLDQLPKLVMQIDDPCFITALVRSVNQGIIPAHYLVAKNAPQLLS